MSINITKEQKKDDERENWEFMTYLAWHNSIAAKDSIFEETYKATRNQIEETTCKGGYDVIIEVGCSTSGDGIGEMNTPIPRVGLNINQDFIKVCQDNHPHDHTDFHVADTLHLVDWWKSKEGLDKLFSKPLVTCVNNTLKVECHAKRHFDLSCDGQ
jgi:hypothetical protein